MAPLPVEGQANWGRVLNEWLLVAHHEDGTLRGVQDVINVRDFGAKGDGNNNDAPAIQAAVDAAFTRKISTVYIPAGEYILKPVGSSEPRIWISGSNLRLVGDGYASHLHVEGSTQVNNDPHAYNALTIAAKSSTAPNNPVKNIEVCGLRLSSNLPTALVDPTKRRAIYSTGIISVKNPPQEPDTGIVENLSIHGCTLETNDLVGFLTDVQLKQFRFYNNHVVETGSHGMYMAGKSTSVWIQNNIFEKASDLADHTATGIALKNVTDLYLTGNVISGYNYCAINPADALNERLFIIGNTIRDMNYVLNKDGIVALAEGIIINWGTKILIANNIFEHIKHTGIHATATNLVSELRIIANEFYHIGDEIGLVDSLGNKITGRAITVEKFHNPEPPHEDRYPSNVTIADNWLTECAKGIQVNGVAGMVKISGNQIQKSQTDGQPDIHVLEASLDTMIDHNITRGYTGVSIDGKAIQSDNVFNGVFQGR